MIVLTHDPLVSTQVNRTIAIRDGRTSTETLRRAELDESGEHRIIAEEFALLDRVGRLQLPREYVEALELERRVRLALERDHVGVWPDRARQRRPDRRRRRTVSDGRLVVAEGVGRDFAVGDSVVHALRDVDFAVPEGTLAVVHGRSGSGKTTLLNVIGGLDRPTRGRIWLDGEEVSGKSEDALVELRREKIGFVFQSFGLVPILSAAENIEVPLRLRKVDPDERTAPCPASCSTSSASAAAPATGPTSSRAASSSASPSAGRWRTGRGC